MCPDFYDKVINVITEILENIEKNKDKNKNNKKHMLTHHSEKAVVINILRYIFPSIFTCSHMCMVLYTLCLKSN